LNVLGITYRRGGDTDSCAEEKCSMKTFPGASSAEGQLEGDGQDSSKKKGEGPIGGGGGSAGREEGGDLTKKRTYCEGVRHNARGANLQNILATEKKGGSGVRKGRRGGHV